MKLKVFIFTIFALLVAFYYLGNQARVQAFLLYHKGSYHSEKAFPVPPERQLQAREHERALGKLQAEFPEVSEPEAGLLLALASGEKKVERRALVFEVLKQWALSQRYSRHLTSQQLEAIWSLEKELVTLGVDLPRLGPENFAGNRILSHRFLIEERVRRWEVYEERSHSWIHRCLGGYPSWSSALRELRQLDLWHRQIDQGQPLTPPGDSDFENVFRALQLLK